MQLTNATIGVGFGTAALGGNTYGVVTMALEAGFRKFDTAEADWWYDQAKVGSALADFFDDSPCDDLAISTKIPPWSLTSVDDIRNHAAQSRSELVGFCDDITVFSQDEQDEQDEVTIPFPLDVYYIHAPKCWRGWHHRCDNPPPLLDLRQAWMGLEAVAGIDHSAQRIGLSNVNSRELLDIIHFAQERIEAGMTDPPPRIPDVLQAYADPLRPAEELRSICEEHGIEFVSYSTLGTQHQQQQNPVLTSPLVMDLAVRHSRSVAEVVLSWALQSGMSVIPRSTKRQHIQELARLLNSPPFLSHAELEIIDSMSQDADAEL